MKCEGGTCPWCNNAAGFHEFAEFTAADVGNAESGLNHMVLANNTEMVLLSLNEPTYGTKRKSQIQVGNCSTAGKPYAGVCQP